MIFLELNVLSQNTGQARPTFLGRFKNTTEKISLQKIFYYIFVYFIALSKLPFGCAIFAAEYSYNLPFATAILVILAGFAPPFSPFLLLKSVSSMLIFHAAAAKFGFKKTPLAKALVMSGCTLFCNIIPKIFSTLVLYDAVILFAQSGIVFLCTYFFQKAKSIFFCPGDETDHSGIFALSIFFVAAICGIGHINIAGVNIGIFFTALALLLFINANNSAAGAAAGIMAGFAIGLSLHELPFYVTLFSCASLLAAFFVRFGKSSSALAFILGTSFASFYSSSAAGFVALTQISLAALTSIFLPEKFVAAFSLGQKQGTPYSLRLRQYTSKALFEKAQVIENLSDTLSELCKEDNAFEGSAASSFFERTTHRLCSECSMKNNCWRSEFHRTYSSFFVLLQICNKNGSISFCDIPEDLMKKCIKTGSISSVFNSMYDIYKVDRLWEFRICESRALMASQLSSIAKSLLEDSKAALSEISFSPEAEKRVNSVLSEEGFNTENVFLCRKKDGECSAEIILSSPDIKTRDIENAVSKALNENYKCVFRRDNLVHLSPLPIDKFVTAIAGKPKSGNHQSGDTATYCHLPGGRYMMLLSDGMGSGMAAGADSHAAAKIATDMLQSGFEPQTTAETINCALVLKSCETSFASVDMAIINTAAGMVDFYKMGAAPAFIKSGNQVKTIYATTLPAGSFAKSDIGHVSCPITHSDIIIMVSDGVANGENTAEIENIISGCTCTDAKSFANELLNYSLHIENKNSDDITVMVTFV